jgi:hypothetical protein
MLSDLTFSAGPLEVPKATSLQQHRIRAREVLKIVPVKKDVNKQDIKQRTDALEPLSEEQQTMNTMLPLVYVNGVKRWAKRSLLEQMGTLTLVEMQPNTQTMENTFAYDHFLHDRGAAIQIEDDSMGADTEDDALDEEPEDVPMDESSEEEAPPRQRDPAISISSDEATPEPAQTPVTAGPSTAAPANAPDLTRLMTVEAQPYAEQAQWLQERVRQVQKMARDAQVDERLRLHDLESLAARLWFFRESARTDATMASSRAGLLPAQLDAPDHVAAPDFETDTRIQIESCNAAIARLREMAPSFFTEDWSYENTQEMISLNAEALGHWQRARQFDIELGEAHGVEGATIASRETIAPIDGPAPQ